MKSITIVNNKVISLRTYLDAWKILRSIPSDQRKETMLDSSLETWWPVSAERCLQQYTNAVHDRINGRASGKYIISDFLNT